MVKKTDAHAVIGANSKSRHNLPSPISQTDMKTALMSRRNFDGAVSWPKQTNRRIGRVVVNPYVNPRLAIRVSERYRTSNKVLWFVASLWHMCK